MQHCMPGMRGWRTALEDGIEGLIDIAGQEGEADKHWRMGVSGEARSERLASSIRGRE